MNELLKEFKQWLTEEGRASKTVESYVGDVKGFQEYLNKKAANENQLLSRFAFVRYKQYLIDEGFAISTINKKINSLKVYNDYLQINGDVNGSFISIKRDRVKVAEGSEHMVDALSDAEVERLLFYMEDHRKVITRDKLIVYLLIYTGVRVSELISIQMNQIDQLTSTLTVHGKGGKIREVSLRHDVVELIRQYVKEERAHSKFHDSPYLLLSQRAPKMHRDAVRDMLAKLSEKLGFHIHPHKFRRTFVTILISKGVPITTVARLTGHVSIQVLEKHYIVTSREDKLRAVELL